MLGGTTSATGADVQPGRLPPKAKAPLYSPAYWKQWKSKQRFGVVDIEQAEALAEADAGLATEAEKRAARRAAAAAAEARRRKQRTREQRRLDWLRAKHKREGTVNVGVALGLDVEGKVAEAVQAEQDRLAATHGGVAAMGSTAVFDAALKARVAAYTEHATTARARAATVRLLTTRVEGGTVPHLGAPKFTATRRGAQTGRAAGFGAARRPWQDGPLQHAEAARTAGRVLGTATATRRADVGDSIHSELY